MTLVQWWPIRRLWGMMIMDFHWLIIGVFAVLAFAGVMRPTGLLGRTRAQQADDRNRAIVDRWITKHGPE